MGGDPAGGQLAASGARFVGGVVGTSDFCTGTKLDGGPCGARPAKDTDYCVGHLRSYGMLIDTED